MNRTLRQLREHPEYFGGERFGAVSREVGRRSIGMTFAEEWILPERYRQVNPEWTVRLPVVFMRE
jgi:hypothetical protein